MAGKPLDDFFKKYVSGREEINYDEILNPFGLKLDVSTGRQNAYLGATLAQEGEKLMVKSLPQGTPAYEQGLNANDQIVAVDGQRATLQFLNTYLGERKPNDKVKLTIFRFDELREMEITLGGKGLTNYRITSVSNPNDEQKALYQGYFGSAK